MTPNSQVTFSAHWISETLGLPNSKNSLIFQGLVTDTRKLAPQSLFACIPGERFDGHTFISQAIAAGATGILGQSDKFPNPLPAGVQFFPVSDTTQALRALAKAWRSQFSIPVICIAGSVGKTTTKELLYAALLEIEKNPGAVLKTQGSENGFLGIPITLLKLTKETKYAIIEVGIDEIGAMEQHLAVVAPTHTILTAIGAEHLEKLKDLKTVATEELKAFDHTTQAIAINLDDPWIAPAFEKKSTLQKQGFSLKSIQILESTDLGTKFSDSSKRTLFLPLPGKHNLRNALGVLALCELLSIDLEAAARGLERFQAAFGRSETEKLPDGTLVFKDYYNANPDSMRAALEILNAQKKPTQKTWACLGDMLELGPNELTYHAELGPLIVSQGLSGVFLYGERMKALYQKLQELEFKGVLKHANTHAELAQALKSSIHPGDRILIKGSRGMKMEELWKEFHGSSRS